jgi:hypothetical protein
MVQHRTKRRSRSLLIALLTWLAPSIGGCAATSVFSISAATPPKVGRPTEVAVYEVAFAPSKIEQSQSAIADIDRPNLSLASLYQPDHFTAERQAVRDLTDQVITKLIDLKFDARKLPRGTLPPNGALVIDGRLLRLDEGDALSRLVIGFGVGASQIDSEVRVYQVNSGAANELLDFKVHSDTGKMPGHAVTMGVGAALTGGTSLMGAAVSGMISGADFWRSMIRSQTNSMANRIVGFVSEYAATQGWVNQSQADLLYQPQSLQDAAKFFSRFK